MKKLLKTRRIAILATIFTLSAATTALAATDPVSAINNLFTLISTIITAIGAIVILYGVFQLGTAHNQNDAGAKNAALSSIVGGAIMAFAPWVVTYIIG